MPRYYRKTTPKVKRGKVQRKNRWTLTPNYYNTPQTYPVLDRERPGEDYRHLLRKKDLCKFIDILPDWEELSKGLNAVVLAFGEPDVMGWHLPGVVGICAWETALEWDDCDPDFHDRHRGLFAKLNIPCWENGDVWHVGFDESAAKAFQLIHVFVHELGHHHDRMTTRSRKDAARGEAYAEDYARRYEDEIIAKYFDAFG